jgi:beta-catenin-like protein 1
LYVLQIPYVQAYKKQRSSTAPPTSEDTSHILGILSSLFSNLSSDSSGRIRLLAKFVENNYEKVDKLLEIHDGARNRLKVTDSEIELERNVRCNVFYAVLDGK